MIMFFALIKKEFSDQIRSGRFMICCLIFVLIGVMNPAVAKLTPWLLEIMADSLAESGMTVTDVNVSSLDSWVQFFKNMPMALGAFALLQGAIFTNEYERGTLILSLTKGLERYKIVLSKTVTLISLWTLGYWTCFAITYGYNEYFWDNSIAESLLFSSVCWWLFGIFIISQITLFSVIFNSYAYVALASAGVIVLSFILGFFPKISEYVPTFLTDGNSLIYGIIKPEKYAICVVITLFISAVCFALSVLSFNKKQL